MPDQAIVVGIEGYPGLNDLHGPCNDALAFRDWLLDPAGGGLDEANVHTCLSREFPPATDVTTAHPVVSDLELLFRPFVVQAATGQHSDGRIFIFVAGHGFADPQDMSSAALMAANAEFLSPVHLAVVEYARFLQRTWAADEIIFVMDACRTTNPLHAISPPVLPQVNPHANANLVKTFIGYGSGFNQVARERAVDGGEVRGIFTMAFLDALRHASPNADGRVDGSAVKRHVHNRIDHFAGAAAIFPPAIVVDAQREVCFGERAPAGTDVTFRLDAAHQGLELVVAFGGVQEVHRQPVAGVSLTLQLSPGLYKARIETTTASVIFEVPNSEQVIL